MQMESVVGESDDDLSDAIAAAKGAVGRLACFAMELQGKLPNEWDELMQRIEVVEDRLSAVDNESLIGSFAAVQAMLISRGVISDTGALAEQIRAMRQQVNLLSKKVLYSDDLH